MAKYDRERFYRNCGGKCYLCGHPVSLSAPPDSVVGSRLTVDHVVPRSRMWQLVAKKRAKKRGWSQKRFFERNVKAACFRCNNRKGNRSVTPNLIAELAATRIESFHPCG